MRFDKNKLPELINELISFLLKNKRALDTIIYANDKCYRFEEKDEYTPVKTENGIYYISNDNMYSGCEYKNDDTVTMIFEGPLYDLLNYETGSDEEIEFKRIFEKYGLYYELGHAWSLAAYKE